MIKISVIVPVYNNEKHILNALESLTHQDVEEIEAIIINDGSEDDSGKLIRSYVSSHSFAKLIEQENQGVSAARNAGLDIAKGEYIAFLDADDRYTDGALRKMLATAVEKDADLVIGEAHSVRTLQESSLIQSRDLSQKEEISIADPDLIYNFSNCNKLFRKSLIDQYRIRFPALRHAEDGVFLYTFLKVCGKIAGCPSYVYEYHKRLSIESKSALKRLDRSMFEECMDACEIIIQLIADFPQETRKELMIRILRVTIINEYYRRLWMMDQDAFLAISEYASRYRQMIGDKNWEEICNKADDFDLTDHLPSKKEIVSCPLISVVLVGEISGPALEDLLSTLYFQICPNFELLVPERDRKRMPDEYAMMENIRYCQGADLTELLKNAKGRFIQIIDGPCFYNENSLQIMQRRLKSCGKDFVSVYPWEIDNEKRIENDKIKECFYPKKKNNRYVNAIYRRQLNRIDHFLVNKLFVKEAALKVAEQSNGIRQFKKNCYRLLKYKRYANAVIGLPKGTL